MTAVNGYLAENTSDAFVAKVVDAFRDGEKRAKIAEARPENRCAEPGRMFSGEVKERYLAILSKWA